MLKALSILSSIIGLGAVPLKAATTTVDATKTYQTIEGLGGATAFYTSWISAHPYKLEIYTNAFAGLNLSMLRLGNWFRYTNGPDTSAYDIVSNANRISGHPVPVFMSSWAPPASLKSNGQTGNGGTLLFTNGGYVYTNFAQYWYDSIQSYRSNGVSPTWMSIQNEPDWAASYDSCRFDPNEDTVNGTNYASYSKALDATFQRLTNLTSPPKILAPEVVGIGYNDVQNYAAPMNSTSFYGVAHHLYHGGTDGTPDGYNATMQALTNVFPRKPKFMTEYGYSNMVETACLIHDCLTVEQAVGFNYWSLIWPFGGDALVQIENPFNLSSWTNAPPGTATEAHGYWLTPSYWAMKHFSYFISPGYTRVNASDNDSNVRVSAFLAPGNLRLVVVLINTNATASSAMNFNFGSFGTGKTSVYQTAGTNTFQSLGSLTNSQALPPLSLTTVVLDITNVNVGAATNPSPANNGSGVALSAMLSWTPGSNAVGHAVYLGINSNAVAQATTTSQEFQGILSTTNFSPPLGAGLTYYWRVDEMAGVNASTGAIWTFSTVGPSANFALRTTDVFGSSSFGAVGNWVTNGTSSPAATPPSASGTYNTATFTLRTLTNGSATFGGGTLTLSAGAPAATGSLLLKGPNGATVTINNLVMSGGVLAQGVNSGPGGIEWVAGNINVVSNSYVSGLGTTARFIGVAANLSGGASISNDCNVVYTGNNSEFSGQLIVGSGGVIQIGGPMNLGGAQLVLDNGTFEPTASFAMNSGANVMLNSGGGTFQIGPNLTLTVSNPISGVGNLLCTGGGTLQVAGNTAAGNLIVSNATLDVTALSAPLVISNDIALAANLAASINKTGFTSLLSASNIIYGGTLTLSNSGPALAYGDTIKLFSASNYSGAFSSIVPAAPGAGLIWNTNWLSVNGTIFVSSTNPALIAPPRITSFQVLGGNIIVGGTNGNAPGTPFYTLATTNPALPLASWTIIATNQFGAGGGFYFTNTFDSTLAEEFFILQIP